MSNDQPHLITLIKQLRDDTTELIREEVALAKTEMTEKASLFSRNAGLLIAGALIGYTAVMLLLLGIASLITQFFISEGWREGSAGFMGLLIISVLVGALSAALISKGLKRLKGKSIAPEKTMETLREDKAWAQRRFA